MLQIVTFMVLSIVSVSTINMVFLGLSAAGVGTANTEDCDYGYPSYWDGIPHCYGKVSSKCSM